MCDDLHSEYWESVAFAVHFCVAFEALRLHADAAQIKECDFHCVFTLFSLCFHFVFTLFSLCFHCVLLYGIVRLFSLFFIDRWCLPAPCSDHFPHLLVDESPNDTEPAAYF